MISISDHSVLARTRVKQLQQYSTAVAVAVVYIKWNSLSLYDIFYMARAAPAHYGHYRQMTFQHRQMTTSSE